MNQPFLFNSPLFKHRHFNHSIIVLCVRGYITHKLSYRDLVKMMAERGLDKSHTTILRLVQRSVPEFAKHWNCYARQVGTSWRVDETYIRDRGKWTYLCRAVEKHGLTVDFLLCKRRQIAAAKRFFTQAIKQHGPPEKITVDGYPATHTAISELQAEEGLPPSTKVRTSKYLNNFTLARSSQRKAAHLSHAGIQEIQECSYYNQRNRVSAQDEEGTVRHLKGSRRGARVSQLWEAVLSA